MLQAFGFGFTPPLSVWTSVSALAKMYNYSITYMRNTETKVGSNLLFFMSVKDFYAYCRLFPKQKSVAIIFDSALRLTDVLNICVLDAKPIAGSIFLQRVQPNKQDYLKPIHALRHNKHLTGITKSRNLIKELIYIHQKNRFLNPFTAFIYSVVAGPQRNLYTNATIEHMLGHTDFKKFDTLIRSTFKRQVSKSVKAYDAISVFIQSKTGIRFKKALQACQISSDARRFDIEGERYKVDAYELRYLTFKLQQSKEKPNGK